MFILIAPMGRRRSRESFGFNRTELALYRRNEALLLRYG